MTIIAAWEQHPRSNSVYKRFRKEWENLTANMPEEEKIIVRTGINVHMGKTVDSYEEVYDECGY